MVKYVNRFSIWVKVILSVYFMVIMVASCRVFAANTPLIDPTRPSMEAIAVGENTEIFTTKNMTKPVLQSVLWSPSRQLVVINGKTYNRGDKVGEATLIKVSVNEAVLRHRDNSLQTLSMYSGVIKKMIAQPLPPVQ